MGRDAEVRRASACPRLPVLGRPEAAWDALETYYSFPDRDAFRAEIEAVVGASPYYATASH